MIVELAKLWMVVRPIKALRERRERKMNAVTVTLPDGTEVQRQEPLIPTRTSTKVAATGLIAGIPVIQYIQEIVFPWPWLEAFTNSDVFVQVATLIFAVVVARLSKSPAIPGSVL